MSNLGPTTYPAARLVFVFRQLSPEAFRREPYRPTAEELRRYPVKFTEYHCSTVRKARDSMDRARRQFDKGWLTDLEYRAIALRCLTAIKTLEG